MSAIPPAARNAFSFVHASDLHLELPPHGLSEIPEHLRDSLLECPYRAAERVFDLALSERADFLVLSGDVLAASSRHTPCAVLADGARSVPAFTGPRGPCFLLKQFQRLRERDIAVYWLAGEADAADIWPAHVELPDNVHRFTPETGAFTHRRGGLAIARLVGVARPDSPQSNNALPKALAATSTGLPTIGVVHVGGAPVPGFLSSAAVHYWALGGRHEAHTLFDDRRMAHFCGSPQGRSPEEAGPHGCTLVIVDEQGAVRHRTTPTDLFRWRRETIAIDDTTTTDQLRQSCRDRLSEIIAAENDVAHLVCWTVQGHGPLARRLRRDALAAELVEDLRSDYGYRNPTAWTVSLDIQQSQHVPGECCDEQTVLGDYLRAVREHQQDAAASIDLAAYVTLDEPQLAGELVQRVGSVSVVERQRLLQQAAWLGVDLLRPQQPGS